MSNIHIQFRDSSEWRTTTTLLENASVQNIVDAMWEAQRAYPSYKIRAADENGRLIDNL